MTYLRVDWKVLEARLLEGTCLTEKWKQQHYTYIAQTESVYDIEWKLPQMHTAKVLNAWPGHTLRYLNGDVLMNLKVIEGL